MNKERLQNEPSAHRRCCMRASMESFLLGLVVASMTCFTGCTIIPEDTFNPLVELQQGTLKFQLAEKHWPRDYEDLSGFLKRSHDPTYASLQTVKFGGVSVSNLLNVSGSVSV
jgi:hypothetical protein